MMEAATELQNKVSKILDDIKAARTQLNSAPDEPARAVLRNKIEEMQGEVQVLRDKKLDLMFQTINNLSKEQDKTVGELSSKLDKETGRIEKKMEKGDQDLSEVVQAQAQEIRELKKLLEEQKKQLEGAFRAIVKLRKDLDDLTNEVRKSNVIIFGMKTDNPKTWLEDEILNEVRGLKNTLDSAFYLGVPKASPVTAHFKTISARDAFMNLFFNEEFKATFPEVVKLITIAPSTSKYKRAGMTRLTAAAPLLRAAFKGLVVYRAYAKLRNKKIDGAAFASPSIYFEGKHFDVDAACQSNGDFEAFLTGEINEFGDRVVGYKKKTNPKTPIPTQSQPDPHPKPSTKGSRSTKTADSRPTDKGKGGDKRSRDVGGKTDSRLATPSVTSGGVNIFLGATGAHGGPGPSNTMGSHEDPYSSVNTILSFMLGQCQLINSAASFEQFRSSEVINSKTE